MTDRVLVTGGAGFIGSHVTDRYLAAGYAVTVLDDLSTGNRQNVPEGAEFIQQSVTAPETRQLVAEGGFRFVNHHAAQIDVRVSVNDPILDEHINIGGLLNLLEGAREGGVARFVFASSGGVVYGESENLPHKEDASKLPVSPYGVSKLSSEYYLNCYRLLFDLEAVALRYANVYGPRQNPHGEAGVVAIFGSRVLAGKPITIFGDGTQTRDYVYVGDVANANLLASTAELSSPMDIDASAYNVGTGVETSVNQLAQAILDVADAEVPIQHQEARAGELQRSAVDPDKAQRLLGWSASASLQDGLKGTYDWIASQQ